MGTRWTSNILVWRAGPRGRASCSVAPVWDTLDFPKSVNAKEGHRLVRTTLHHLMVELIGLDISDLSPPRRSSVGLGRTFQAATLFPELTVRESVQVALEARERSSFVKSALFLNGPAESSASVLDSPDPSVTQYFRSAHLVPHRGTGSQRSEMPLRDDQKDELRHPNR